MQRVAVSKWIEASPQGVWDLYTDHVSWQRWAGLGRVRLAETGSPERDGAGCVREISRLGFRVLERVEEFEPPTRMTYRVVGGMFPVRNHLGVVEFSAEGAGTRVDWSCEFESAIPGISGWLRLIVTRTFTDVLVRLSRVDFGDAAVHGSEQEKMK